MSPIPGELKSVSKKVVFGTFRLTFFFGDSGFGGENQSDAHNAVDTNQDTGQTAGDETANAGGGRFWRRIRRFRRRFLIGSV